LSQRALAIRKRVLGSEHPDIAASLNGLANIYCGQGRYTKAESLYRRALHIQELRLGQHHPKTGQTLHNLAVFRQKQGNLSEAFSLAERALSIRSQALGDAHPKTAATRTLLAQLEQELACADDLTVFTDGDAPSPVESDALQPFLDACCELHPRAWCRSTDLWKAYECWVQEHEERFPLSRRAFTTQLKAYGCRPDRTNRARIWRGIALLNQDR
ncbi:MAG TPA: tetratricopeptide repeat protein, partial [Ktedonobacteraceae bacterium]|nr:tetratricopeptide repeat protein [Ktedonobacteraceae bacterium]